MAHTLLLGFESIASWSNILYNLRRLRRNTWLPLSELEKMQAKRLKGIVRHAYSNIPFYHQTFNAAKLKPDDIRSVKDLCKLPFTTKSEVQMNSNSLIVKGVDIAKCAKEETSGSTGIPLTVFAEKRVGTLLKANELRHYIENGGRLLQDRFVLIGANIRRKSLERTALGSLLKRLGIYRNIRLSILDPMEEVFTRLVDYKPDVIKATTSSLLMLAREIKKRGRLIHPKFIWSNGELLDARSRRVIGSTFGAEVLDGYACTEAGYVAWECLEHFGYHLNMDMVVTEFVNDGEQVAPGERGEIILTPLWNYAMPLIRYRVGDVGTPGKEMCPCGRGLPLMKVLEGRLDDFVILPSGRIISPHIAPVFIQDVEGIAEFRIIQEKEDVFTIQVELREGYDDTILPEIVKKFQNGLGEEVIVNVKILDAMPKSGKLRSVVSKCIPRDRFLER